jgi:hypothetical protein
VWEKKNAIRVFVTKLEGKKKDSMEYLDVDEKIPPKVSLI